MRVREAMTPDVETLDAHSPVQRAAARMKELDLGFLPVVDGGRLVGVLTDRDIACRFVADGLDFSGTAASDIMSRDPVCCGEDDDLKQTLELMARRKIRRVVVLDAQGRLVGILSRGDALAGSPRRMKMKRNRAGKAMLTSLVFDELAAVETYKEAVERFSDSPEAVELRRIENEHEEAATLLQEQIAEMGEEPPLRCDVWGPWSLAISEETRALGGRAAIDALKLGEEHDLADYEKALADLTLGQDTKSLIMGHLIPRTRAHIPILEQFLSGGRDR